MKAVSLV